MGKTITINLDETIEKRFKERARLKYGNRKGSLAKAMNEALEEWLKRLGSRSCFFKRYRYGQLKAID